MKSWTKIGNSWICPPAPLKGGMFCNHLVAFSYHCINTIEYLLICKYGNN
jgi:hypothetical protein